MQRELGQLIPKITKKNPTKQKNQTLHTDIPSDTLAAARAARQLL